MEVRILPPQLVVPASSNGRTPVFEAEHRGSNPCAGSVAVFTGSSEAERRAVNPRLRRFDSCPVSRWLAGPHGEGTGLQNRRARFDPGASLSKRRRRRPTVRPPGSQSGNGGFNSPRRHMPRSTSGRFPALQAGEAGSTPARGTASSWRTARKAGCSGAVPRMRRKHEIVGSIPTTLTVSWGRGSVAERVLDGRKRLVRLQPSLFMAADDQWQISGLWPREAKASSEFDSLRSP
jgi:hypothetical protein